jgi:hypothetical protein
MVFHLRLVSKAPPSHGAVEPGPPAPSALVAAAPAGPALDAMDQG